jgi:uncharacterized protein YbcV (DUF1398 family)
MGMSMDARVKQVIEDCARASNDGTAHFGEVVQTLLGVGVESYYADYRAQCLTYYLPGDEALQVPLPGVDGTIAQAFDAAAIQSAIRGAQRGEVMYPEFKQLSQAGGCIGYMVWLAGRHVTYYGRRGETHVERFPD